MVSSFIVFFDRLKKFIRFKNTVESCWVFNQITEKLTNHMNKLMSQLYNSKHPRTFVATRLHFLHSSSP